MSRKILETLIDGHCINIGVVEMEMERPVNIRIDHVPYRGELKLLVKQTINNKDQYEQIGTLIRY
jgi:hypothetical protein